MRRIAGLIKPARATASGCKEERWCANGGKRGDVARVEWRGVQPRRNEGCARYRQCGDCRGSNDAPCEMLQDLTLEAVVVRRMRGTAGDIGSIRMVMVRDGVVMDRSG